MTMKMMSKTSTTSTSGVTFISGSSRLRDPVAAAVPMDVLHLVKEFSGRPLEPELNAADTSAEVVEEEHCRDGHHETEGRFDEGFRNTRRHGPETARPRRCNA